MNKPKDTCFNCAYGYGLMNHSYTGGECRRYGKTQALFPTTDAKSWCGEHKPKEEQTSNPFDVDENFWQTVCAQMSIQLLINKKRN